MRGGDRKGRGRFILYGEDDRRTRGSIEVYHVETFVSLLGARVHGFGHVLHAVPNQIVARVARIHFQLDEVFADVPHRQAAGLFRFEPLDQLEPSGDFSQNVLGRARVQAQFLHGRERYLTGEE